MENDAETDGQGETSIPTFKSCNLQFLVVAILEFQTASIYGPVVELLSIQAYT